MTISILIHSAVSAVCPIDGISIGDLSDKSTWKVNAKSFATQAELIAAQTAINNFNVANAQQAEVDRKTRATTIETESAADQFIDKLRNATPDQIRTFIGSNITDLNSAKILLGRMAIAIAYLLRNE